MFDGYDILFDSLLKEAANKMKFREQSNYRERVDAFGETIRAYREARERDKETTDGLEELMLEAYRFMGFIRQNNSMRPTQPAGMFRPISTALSEVIEILDEPLEYCVPMYREADALEVLSFSIFKDLKEKGEVKYCKHCQKFMNSICKKHKEPSSVEDLFYCGKCRGYLTNPCLEHQPESGNVFP